MHFLQELRQISGLSNVKELLIFVRSRVRDTHIQEVASSMTLTTIFSIVPLLAVSLAAFAVFPSFADSRQALEDAIFHSFIPEQYSAQVITYLRHFSQHASGLGVAGLVGLALTALLLIDKFFVTVNQIFNVRRLRTWGHRALLYWALITLGPAFFALSLTVSTQVLTTAVTGIAPSFTAELLQVAHFFLQILAFTFLFKFVPNCHVPIRHALVGGTVVAVLFLCVRGVFEFYIAKGTMTNIYGAFVALPALILWLYLTWFIVFTGAAVTATIPVLTTGRSIDHYRAGNEFLSAVAMLCVLTKAKQEDKPLVSLRQLCRESDNYPQAALGTLEGLSELGYVAQVARDANRTAWVLVSDPKETTLLPVAEKFLIDSKNELVSVHREKAHSLAPWYALFASSSLWSMPMNELVDELEKARHGSGKMVKKLHFIDHEEKSA